MGRGSLHQRPQERHVLLGQDALPGSGKTTYFPVASFGLDAFSVDDRCAQIVGSYRAIPPSVRKAVSKECESFVLAHIRRKRSFAIETTLRTLVSAEQARKARRRGFRTEMIFLCTASADINVERVLQRAQAVRSSVYLRAPVIVRRNMTVDHTVGSRSHSSAFALETLLP